MTTGRINQVIKALEQHCLLLVAMTRQMNNTQPHPLQYQPHQTSTKHTLYQNLDNQNVDTGMKQTTHMMATYTTSVIRKAAPPQVRQHSADQAKTAKSMHIGVEVATQPRL